MDNHDLRRQAELLSARDRVVAKYGPWTSHNIHLGEGAYTMAADEEPNWRVQHFARIIRDFGYPSIEGIRILDLACLEGLFAIEFAKLGAQTIGVEIRQASIEKARFAKEVLQLDRCVFVQNDVRNVKRADLGMFDVVLCAGILYHLDFPDVITFLRTLAELTKGVLIIDTHIALENLRQNSFELGKMRTEAFDQEEYQGRFYVEHRFDASPQEKAMRLWASADNVKSFWLTRVSLLAALRKCGFGAVYEAAQNLSQPVEDVDRSTFIAVARFRDSESSIS